jgi:hypothetical protein
MTKIFVDDLATLLTYTEVNKLKPTAIFQFTENEYPVALNLFVGGKIAIETLNIINELTGMVDEWSLHPSVRYIWEAEMRRIKKLTGFVKYDRIKIGKIFEHFKEELAE